MQTTLYNFGDSLEKIEKEIKECKKCPLYKTRKNAVPGEGGFQRRIMFVGEAPGRREDELGRPFVGAAGKFLDELLASIGLSRKDVYITNIVKCRPPGNRDPTDEEIKLCSPYLDRQIAIMKPRIICPLGRFSAKYILEKFGFEMGKISKIQGKVFEGNILILPMYHPAAALYHQNLKSELYKSFEVLKSLL
ncbi:type-4 uracil-DNA glycosylase [Candidatus Aciduliprofundum boonei]|uniref:Type-4 uracil-DNA glycosylase n=1 Tax=Aciduliprofundum boonei (strain DSM 19572 / T469) TaxID=439481 RepID=B5IEQ6_ACIB4|nr:type-4 uracil-DNA glycosylase [Candidatus Aciduliprofundum boonei]ADD07931.1 phage SPO1 DNA polymerase-related protein [Aciduliprofundum boonei T469]EDY35192.1 uracil-DNA glycosylase, family 4 [Aciduliprofundum boonei T469]HII55583.1 uracil-DNA glycosylase [Candidatus Aciduliprofundum boonei]